MSGCNKNSPVVVLALKDTISGKHMAKVAVIIPAAGAGKRFGGSFNKIFQPLNGEPIFLRTLAKFTVRDDVIQTQLVVAPADIDRMKDQFGPRLESMGVTVVPGGQTRSVSVRNGLARLDQEAELVCIHDAVRPCVSSIWIDAVFAEAARTGGAILAYPVHGTLKKVSPGQTIEKTVSREDLWEAQTPQVFRRDLIIAAYENATDSKTDDAQLLELTGRDVSVVMGDPRNIKITTPGDLVLATAVIDTLP